MFQAFFICADYPKCMSRSGGAQTLRRVLAAAALGATLPASATASAADISGAEGARHAPGEVLVRYEPGTGAGGRRQVREGIDADLERRLAIPRAELLALPQGRSVGAAVAELRDEPEVAFAEPNYVYRLATTPNDPEFSNQWALSNDEGLFGVVDSDIDAPEAWNTTTGSDDVVVGVVDSGITLEHEDLAGNIWVNPGETGGDLDSNGIDDDSNLMVDDHRGWDFVQGDNDPTDGEGHGTHVAGIIGAEGDNGVGIAGVNWDVSLMPLRACDSLGACLNSDVADAFAYAASNGAQVVNASLSGSGSSLAQQAAIAGGPGTLFVVAAGNDGTSNEGIPRYPCNYPFSNVVCVAATNDRDELSSFSNFGASTVDLAAPGGGAPGTPVRSTYKAERMTQTFFAPPLSGDWETGGTPNSWNWTDEASQLPGGKLTDSPGGLHAEDADNFARFGPVDLGSDSSCDLRYQLELDLPDPGDHLLVQASADDNTYATLQDWTGVGEATLTPSVSGFAGSSTVFIRFGLLADGDANVGDGAHIDNVRIRCASSGYAYLQGTSMATPHVSGAAALMLADDGGATVPELRQWLLDGVDLEPGLEGAVASGGRLNLARSLAGAGGADIHRPDTTITSAPAASGRSTRAGFSFSADEPSSFQCSLDAAPPSSCTSPLTLSGLAVGTHGFRVRAVDSSGNQDSSPASYTFVVRRQHKKLTPCAKAKRKLKRARTERQRLKLRKRVKRVCRGRARGATG